MSTLADRVRDAAADGGTAAGIADRLGVDVFLVELTLRQLGANLMNLNGSCGPACVPDSKACRGCPIAQSRR